jgi:2-polyprenyl-3-methyl-5-hydroxy-6-metoxy-1,4-benzoquinol methylase
VNLAACLAWLPRKRHALARETWEQQYESGDWDYLSSLGELAHYSVIVGYCRYFNPRAAILDVGCGEGILQTLLSPSYSRYLGVDLSTTAIERATARRDANTMFVQGDAGAFDTHERFDIVVFNECLGYFEQPLEITRRYEGCLEPAGIFIVSNVISRRTRRARRDLQLAYELLDCVVIRGSRDIRWQLQVFEPRPGSAVACQASSGRRVRRGGGSDRSL